MSDWFEKLFLAPPQLAEVEDSHRAGVLNTVTTFFTILFLLIIPFHFVGSEKRMEGIVIGAAGFTLSVLLHYWLKKQKYARASAGVTVLAFLWLSILNIGQGTVRSPSAFAYIFVILLAGQFFGWKGIAASTAACLAAIFGLYLAEVSGLLPEPSKRAYLVQWATYIALILITGFISLVNNRITLKSLRKAQTENNERARVEKDLRKLSYAVDQSPASIVITNTSGTIEYVNSSFTRLTGYSREEAVGKNPRILKTDLTLPETHTRLWQTISNGSEWRGEFANHKKDGSLFYESAVVSPIKDENGAVTHFLAVKEDITEKRRVEEALQKTTEMYRLLSENISDVIWILDLTENRFRYVSPSVVRLRGYTVEEVLAQSMTEALTVDSLNGLMEKMADRLDQYHKGLRDTFVDELAQPCRDGSIVWTETTSVFQTNVENGHLEVYGVSRGIADRKRSQNLLQTRLRLLESSAGMTLDDFLVAALDRIEAFSSSCISFYHFVEPDEIHLQLQAWSSRTMREFCKAEGKGMHYRIDEAGVWVDCVRDRKPVIHNNYATLPNRKGLPSGHAPVLRELVVPVFRGGKVVAILGVGNKPTDYTEEDIREVSYLADVVWEISRQKQAESRLDEVQSRLNLLSLNLEDAGLIVYTRDAHDNSHFEYLSASMESLTGVKVDDAMRDAETLTANILPDYRPVIRDLLKKSAETLEQFRVEIQQRHAVTGEIRWLLLTFTPRKRSDNSTVWYGFQLDITERKRAEKALQEANEQLHLDMEKIEMLQAELREQTLRDPLTGLYNRRYMSETISRELARSEREKTPVSFIMADIDHFKTINDTYGHQTGDQFLVQIADVLKANARSSDIACRYGGEEFLIVLSGASADQAEKRARELKEKIASLTVPHNGKVLKVTMSFGVAAIPEHGTNAQEVIACSDRALYRSKTEGRDRVTIWRQD